MSKFKITYDFTGSGETTIEADTEEEAEEIFDSGDYTPEDEQYFNNDIVEIKELKNKGEK